MIDLSCEEMIAQYADMVYRIALSQLGSREAAEDIFQDVFLQLVRHIQTLKSEEHVKYWLIRTTINHCKNYFGSAWQKRTVSMEEQQFGKEEPFPSDLYYLVLSLPSKLKGVVCLYYYERYEINEIALILKIKPGTVKSRLHRARKILKEELSKE